MCKVGTPEAIGTCCSGDFRDSQLSELWDQGHRSLERSRIPLIDRPVCLLLVYFSVTTDSSMSLWYVQNRDSRWGRSCPRRRGCQVSKPESACIAPSTRQQVLSGSGFPDQLGWRSWLRQRLRKSSGTICYLSEMTLKGPAVLFLQGTYTLLPYSIVCPARTGWLAPRGRGHLPSAWKGTGTEQACPLLGMPR